MDKDHKIVIIQTNKKVSQNCPTLGQKIQTAIIPKPCQSWTYNFRCGLCVS